MLPSLSLILFLQDIILFDSENSIAVAKRKSYFVVNTHQ